MKIVDVCAFFTPTGGGVKTYIERKLAAGSSRGHDIVILAPGDRNHDEPRGPGARIRWLRSPRFPLDRSYRYFTDRAALHAALDEEDADVVEVSSPWRSASMVADWSGRALRSLVAHADPLSAYAYRWFGAVADRAVIDRGFDWYWRHLRRLNALFDVVVCASPGLTDRLRDGGVTKAVTNAMGVEAGRFSPTLRDEALRRRLLAICGLSDNALLLLGVGRHAPEKRWQMITDAATAAGRDHPLGLVIVGDGHGRRKVIDAAGDNPHIRLIAPIADREAFATLVASADALIHGCEAETFCFIAAEAAASGLPIIAPDMGGAADLARASGGLTYRSGSAQSAADAIASFRRDRIVLPAPTNVRTINDHFDDLFATYADRLRPTARERRAG